jgi:alcohol dehydrogenase (cytochrome c)
MKKISIIIAVLAVAGAAIGGGLYLAFPVQMSTIGGLTHVYFETLNPPAGTLSTETNAAYQAPVAPVAPAVPASTATPASADASSASNDWPSYNRTVGSQRYSTLNEINKQNVGKLKVLCTYDTHSIAAFESGLIMADNALIGTTEFDIFSLNPATCAENWRTHEDYPASLLPSNRGASYMDGMLFRGTQDGRVLGYDFKTGKRLWVTTIADAKLGESVPSAPIAYDGLVYVGNSGGDFKGGKGHVYALEAKTGKIVWEFYLAPKTDGDAPRGPVGASPLDESTWKNAPGIPVSGAGTWTSYTLDTKTGQLYVPGGNPAPDFVQGGLDGANARAGSNLYSDSVVVLDSKTGDYKSHFKTVPHDWHDWDVSNPPILIQTMGGKQLMAVAPKDGHLYGVDLATNTQVYRVPVTTVENADVAFTPGKSVHFCPGPVGGDEWNSPAYVPETNLILLGEVDWCYSVTVQDDKQLRGMSLGAPWTGMHALNPFNMFGDPNRIADNGWGGWLYAVDADTGVWKWRAKSNYPVVAGITPTAGGIVFFGDVGGNFYALDAATGEKLFGQQIGGAMGGGVITYTANGAQKVAVAYGFSMLAWPVKIHTAKVAILGVDNGSAAP